MNTYYAKLILFLYFAHIPFTLEFSAITFSKYNKVTEKGSYESPSPLYLFKSKWNDDIFEQGYFIRKALFVDVGPASKILTDGFFSENTNFITYQIERLNTYLSLESSYPKPNEKHTMLVACQSKNGKVIAMAEVDGRKQSKKNDPLHAVTAPRPYMYNLVVDRKWRKRGIATALIDACENEVANEWKEDKLTLKVRESNSVAVEMYKRHGYSVVAIRNDLSSEKKSTNISDHTLLLMEKKFNVTKEIELDLEEESQEVTRKPRQVDV